jgi:outer membrane biosynthesis protein TonB
MPAPAPTPEVLPSASGASLAPVSVPAPAPYNPDTDAALMRGRRFRLPDRRWTIAAAGTVGALVLAGALVWGSGGSQAPAAAAATPDTPQPEPSAAAEPVAETAAAEQAPEIEQAEQPERPQGDVRLVLSQMRTSGGKLSKRDVSSSLRKQLPQIERCYERALRKRPQLEGRTVFSFTVNRRGAVQKVTRVSSTLGDRAVYRCSAAAIKKTRFPKPKRKPATVRLPLAYRN